MADYYDQTVIQQTLPDADMTPIERLLLTRIFDGVMDGDGWYFHAPESPASVIWATRAELEEALTATHQSDSTAYTVVAEQLAGAEPDAADIDLDLSGTSWEFFVQDIVKRSKTLRYVSVVAAFTCSRTRPDGFGGMAVLITPDAIFGKSTSDLIREFLAATGLDGVEDERGAL